jgi:hypothetical protein
VRYAYATACARSRTPAFPNAWLMCVFTVASLTRHSTGPGDEFEQVRLSSVSPSGGLPGWRGAGSLTRLRPSSRRAWTDGSSMASPAPTSGRRCLDRRPGRLGSVLGPVDPARPGEQGSCPHRDSETRTQTQHDSMVELHQRDGGTYTDGRTRPLFTPEGRHLGILGLNTDADRHPTEAARDLIGTMAPGA